MRTSTLVLAAAVATASPPPMPPGMRQATVVELWGTGSPLFRWQSGTKTGVECNSTFKHACLGHAHTTYGGRIVNTHARLVASRLPTDANASGTLDGLGVLADALLQFPGVEQPELVIVGDSVSGDFWAATILGLRRLGYSLRNETEFLCVIQTSRSMGKTSYVESEPVIAGLACPPRNDTVAVFSAGFAVRYGWFHEGAYEDAAVVVANHGVHANDPSDYLKILNSIRPLFAALASRRRPPRVLWRETLPQHFPGEGGLFRPGGPTTCAPLRESELSRARWRNTLFEEWRAGQPAFEDVAIVEAFDAFVHRHDLHLPKTDCTHYLYSPFAWRRVWDEIARHVAPR